MGVAVHRDTHASRPVHSRRLRRPAFVTLAVAVCLIAGVLVAAAPPAGATPAWSVVPSPNPRGSTSPELVGVSCPNSTSCFAVGDTDSGPSLVEHWNGSSWKITTIPNPIDAPLFGVSCPSTTSCFVVGNNLISSLMDHWNGKSWSVMTIADPAGSVETALTAVSCRSTTSCFAVGYYATSDGDENTLAERWNGSTWSVMATPNPPGSILPVLYGVSCPSTTSCFAVGDYDTAFFAASPTLVEHWNGSRWKIMTSPNPPGDSANLVGVSCPSTTSCFAVGYATFGTFGGLVERWNGSSWKITSIPSLFTNAALYGVSCPSSTSCFAVGDTDSGPSLVEHWNGSSWSPMASPNPTGSTLTVPEGVSCPSTTSCFAVGFYKPLSSADDISNTLVERYA